MSAPVRVRRKAYSWVAVGAWCVSMAPLRMDTLLAWMAAVAAVGPAAAVGRDGAAAGERAHLQQDAAAAAAAARDVDECRVDPIGEQRAVELRRLRRDLH